MVVVFSYSMHFTMFGEFGRAVQTYAFLRGYTPLFLDTKTHKNITVFVYTSKKYRHFSHIAYILRCFISFHWQCERMRFYVVFAGTWILAEIA